MAKKDAIHEEVVTSSEVNQDTLHTSETGAQKHEKGLGNTGSITGNSHTAETPSEHGQPQPSKLAVWWQRIVGSIGILALLGVGVFYVFTMINTPPIAVNPTNEPVTFEIDGSGVTIPAGGYQELKMNRGKHAVTSGGKELGTFEYGWFDQDSVLNPTMSAFVIADILYASSSGYESKLQNRTITIEGETVE